MKARKTALTLVMLFVGLTMCAAQNPNLGTWKLNETKSKLSPGLPKNLTVKYVAAGDNIKATVDGSTVKGSPRITSGRESSMAKTIRSRAIPLQTRGRLSRSTTGLWL